jgi:nucleobase transporter 1/2
VSILYNITICCRLINPVVVAPTVAAVGLAFFSYGFSQAGICLEITVPQIALVLLFTLVSHAAPITGSKVIA